MDTLLLLLGPAFCATSTTGNDGRRTSPPEAFIVIVLRRKDTLGVSISIVVATYAMYTKKIFLT